MTCLDSPTAGPPGLRPTAKGWCPGAHRAMASGDGLLVRVRPHLARLTVSQALGLCEVAQRFGSGLIDLSNRANLQLRGVIPSAHHGVINALCRLGLLDPDAAREAWPAILVTPCWQAGDDSERVATELSASLGRLPALPPKFGFAVDAGSAPVLGAASADVRIERARSGGLIVRADGAELGHPVTRADAVDVALALATWFAATARSIEPASRRMRRHLLTHPLPHDLQALEPPAPPADLPRPGHAALGPVYGVAFGQIQAAALARLLRASGAVALRLTPHRALILEAGTHCDSSEFLTAADDPLLRVDACPGAPSCPSATVETRVLARSLSPVLATMALGACHSLHVSGCAKGCARAHAADITLVGRNAHFDLVRGACAWDTPSHHELAPEAVLSFIGAL